MSFPAEKEMRGGADVTLSPRTNGNRESTKSQAPNFKQAPISNTLMTETRLFLSFRTFGIRNCL
jgi:hypothetical protein